MTHREPTLHDLPTIMGLSQSPSPWELYQQCRGTLEGPRFNAVREVWRREIAATITSNIRTSHDCDLSAYKALLPPAVPMALRNLVYIENRGTLPVGRDTTVMLVRQVSQAGYERRWLRNGRMEVPVTEVLRAHLYMHAYGAKGLALAVVIAGEPPTFVEVAYDERTAAEAFDKIETFKGRLERGDAPPIDYAVDTEALFDLYKPEKEKVLDMRAHTAFKALVGQYENLRERQREDEKTAKSSKAAADEVKGQLKNIAKDHGTVMVDDLTSVVFQSIYVGPSNRPETSYQKVKIKSVEA